VVRWITFNRPLRELVELLNVYCNVHENVTTTHFISFNNKEAHNLVQSCVVSVMKEFESLFTLLTSTFIGWIMSTHFVSVRVSRLNAYYGA